jgi:hypothetical protein
MRGRASAWAAPRRMPLTPRLPMNMIDFDYQIVSFDSYPVGLTLSAVSGH